MSPSDQSTIVPRLGREQRLRFQVEELANGKLGVWLDGDDGPIANLRLVDEDARKLANAILATRIVRDRR